MPNKSWKIRDIVIDNQVVIAPMAGISNPAFRVICKQFGAGLIYTEMVSDKALYYDNEKTIGMTNVEKEEHPLTMQIFGHDIETMVYAAKLLDEKTDCDIIDINMGCPVNKIIKSNAGSALMKDVDHAVNLAKAVVEAVKKPVTVKMRIGWDMDQICCVELAKRLEEVGNGDIRSKEDALRMLEETGCDAVMIGRGVLGDPWLIKEVAAYLETGEELPSPSIEEKFSMAKLHAQRLCDLKGEHVGMREMRGHAAWYVKGLPGSHKLKDALTKMETYEEMLQILAAYEEYHKNS